MKKQTRKEKTKKMIFDSLNNLFKNQTELSFDEFVLVTLEALMLLEREEYLKSHKGAQDSGNGSYLRSFKSLSKNRVQVSIPRSRNGYFKPLAVDLIKQQAEQIRELALLLYRTGNSSRDVSYILKHFFGESMSRESINNLADSFQEIREEWEKQRLDAHYKVIYCDALFVTLKRGNSYSKEAVYVIYGVKDDNTRELLLLEVSPTESSSVWGEYLGKLKKRGIERIDLIVVDGLPNFPKEAKKHYSQSDIQRCVVHLQRSILGKIRPRDREAFALDLKHIFANFEGEVTKEEVFRKIMKLKNKWGGMYGKVLDKLSEERIQDYLTYIKYPPQVRKMIYTTNSIENLNRQIRKVIKTKLSFKSEDNLLNLIYMVIKDFEATHWEKYPIYQYKWWPNFTHKS